MIVWSKSLNIAKLICSVLDVIFLNPEYDWQTVMGAKSPLEMLYKKYFTRSSSVWHHFKQCFIHYMWKMLWRKSHVTLDRQTMTHKGIYHGPLAFCAVNFSFSCCRALSFFFSQTAHIFSSLIKTIDSVMVHITRNLQENSQSLTVDGSSSVAGRT